MFISTSAICIILLKYTICSCSMEDFIVEDSEMVDCGVGNEREEEESLFYVNVDRSLSVGETSGRRKKLEFDSNSDSEDEHVNVRPVFKTPITLPSKYSRIYYMTIFV